MLRGTRHWRSRTLRSDIRLTDSDSDAHIRSGDFATVDWIGEDNSLSVRLDNGKSVELNADHARHIEYAYVVETAQRATVDRVLITGGASHLTEQEETLTRLSPHTHIKFPLLCVRNGTKDAATIARLSSPVVSDRSPAYA